MGLLNQARTLGLIGAILEIFPYVDIIGYILVLIAVKHISDYLQDKSIFNDMIYAVITGIVGVIVGFGILVSSFFLAVPTFGLSSLAGIFVFLGIGWIILIISAIFIRRSFNKIAARLNINYFKTAGTLYLIGAITLIIFVGLIILLVAYIFQILAFNAVEEKAQPAEATTMPPPPPAMILP